MEEKNDSGGEKTEKRTCILKSGETKEKTHDQLPKEGGGANVLLLREAYKDRG